MKPKSRFKFLPWPGFEPRTLQSDGQERHHYPLFPQNLEIYPPHFVQFTFCLLHYVCFASPSLLTMLHFWTPLPLFLRQQKRWATMSGEINE